MRLTEIIVFTGLWADLYDPSNDAVRNNWDLLVPKFGPPKTGDWTLNEIRYLPGDHADLLRDHERLEQALDDPSDGILTWLSRHP